MAYSVLLSYLGFNDEFKIHTDDSGFQLVSVIFRNGKPITFYSRRLNVAQTRYTSLLRNNFPGFTCWGDMILS